MQNSIKIDTGEIRLAIEDRHGNIRGEIKFSPKDVLFAERFYNLMRDFNVKTAEYEKRAKEIDENTAVDSNDLPVNMPEGLNLLKETCTYFREKIDETFGEGTSQAAFGDAMVLDVFAQFFKGVSKYIEVARDEELAPYLPKKPVTQIPNVRKPKNRSRGK